VFPDEEGAATLDSDNSTLIISDPELPVAVTIEAGAVNPTINVGAFITDGSGELPQITINVGAFITDGSGELPQITINAGPATVSIPDGTTVTSEDDDWDGVIAAPTITDLDLDGSTVSSAIEVGLPAVKLSFDKGVRLLLPLQAGKQVGYKRGAGAFTEITPTWVKESRFDSYS
jgi:hypothetical protein